MGEWGMLGVCLLDCLSSTTGGEYSVGKRGIGRFYRGTNAMLRDGCRCRAIGCEDGDRGRGL